MAPAPGDAPEVTGPNKKPEYDFAEVGAVTLSDKAEIFVGQGREHLLNPLR